MDNPIYDNSPLYIKGLFQLSFTIATMLAFLYINSQDFNLFSKLKKQTKNIKFSNFLNIKFLSKNSHKLRGTPRNIPLPQIWKRTKKP
jgi:hypothetical protein